MTSLLSRRATNKKFTTPLLFVHGQWFGGWCWEENYFTFFNDRGFDTHAVNLRGHNKRGFKTTNRSWMPTATIQDYVEDVVAAVAQLTSKPILIGHGLGSNVILNYMISHSQTVAGICLLSPLPFNKGNLRDSPFYQKHKSISYCAFWLGLGKLLNNYTLAQQALFTNGATGSQVRRHEYYASQLQNESPRAMKQIFNQGSQSHLLGNIIPIRLIGGLRDTLISPIGIIQIANILETEPIFIDVAHAMMLDTNWHRASHAINDWIVSLEVS